MSDDDSDGDGVWDCEDACPDDARAEQTQLHNTKIHGGLLAANLRAPRAQRDVAENSARVFHMPRHLVKILDRDLAAADVPKTDADGRTVDVHAMRHTTATYLAKAGVAPRIAQSLLRHSDVRLTLGTYTDARLLNTVGALNALPALTLTPKPERLRLLGR